ncbi:hypothetical protein C8R45DRAFT_1208983, partial [Mycena sanguinolenta]
PQRASPWAWHIRLSARYLCATQNAWVKCRHSIVGSWVPRSLGFRARPGSEHHSSGLDPTPPSTRPNPHSYTQHRTDNKQQAQHLLEPRLHRAPNVRLGSSSHLPNTLVPGTRGTL